MVAEYFKHDRDNLSVGFKLILSDFLTSLTVKQANFFLKSKVLRSF